MVSFFGKALIIGGSENYIGAVGFAAEAAYRSGVGLVTVAVPREIYLTVATAIPEATVMPLNLNQFNSCADETSNTRLILEATQGYSSLLFGCGVGLSRESGVISNNLLLSGVNLPPIVLDADGLNLISKVSNWWDRLPSGTVLTPHPGEMATLTGNKISEIQSKRRAVATRANLTAQADPSENGNRSDCQVPVPVEQSGPQGGGSDNR